LKINRTSWAIGVALILCAGLASPVLAQSYSLTVDMPDGGTYYPTQPVQVDGTLDYGGFGIGGALVSIKILNPSGNLFLLTSATTDSDGYYDITFSTPGNAPTGTYTVNVYSFGESDQTTFTLSSSYLSVDPTSWTIGDYGYVQTGQDIPDKVFAISNADSTGHSATVTHPDFLSFGGNSSGFSISIPASGTGIIVTDVDTDTPGDYSGQIVIDSATGGVLSIPVSMKVRDTLSPDVDVDPDTWDEVTYRNPAGSTESFNVANNGNQGVQVSVSESISKVTILDSWASSFFLPPDTSRTFRAWANTTLSGQISGNIVVDPDVGSNINIGVDITVTNQPPTVQIDAPQNGSTVTGTTTIAVSGSDPDGDDVTYYITLVDLTNTDNRTVFPGSSYDWPTLSSPEGWYMIIGNATDGEDWISDSVKVEVVHNRPPTASTPSTSDISGTHSFRVRSTISDPDGDDVTATLYHRRQGTSSWSTRSMSGSAPGTYQATISTSDYSVGQTVEFYVVAEDSPGATYTTSTSSHAVPNSPPSVGTPTVTESGRALTVTATVSDQNGDTVAATLRHRRYGAPSWNSKPMTVGASSASAEISTDDGYSAGELIQVQVVASDSWSSTSSAITTATITNNPPEIDEIQESPGAGHTLEISATVTEPDEDEIDSVVLYYRESGESWSDKEMTLTGGYYSAVIGPSDGIAIEAVVEYKILAADEFGTEAETSVQTAELGNEAPTIGEPTTGGGPSAHSLTINFPVSDVDGDSIVSAKLVHRIYGTATWAVRTMEIVSGIATATVTSEDGYQPIHTVEYKAEVEDEYGAVSTSAIHTTRIPNQPPVFEDIDTAETVGEHLATVSATLSDPEGDSILQVLLEHRAAGEGDWDAKSMPRSGTEASATLSVEDGYAADTTIEYRIIASDNYGASRTSSVFDLTLPNAAPETSRPSLLARDGHQLEVSATVSDLEGDTMSAYLQHRGAGTGSWKEIGMVRVGNQARYTITIANGYRPNQEIELRILVRDQYGAESLSETRQTHLPNRVPTIDSVTIEDVNGTHEFFVEIDGWDADDDRLFPTCRYRKVNRTIWKSFPVSDRVKIVGELGAQYEVKFELSDSYDTEVSEIMIHSTPNSGPIIAATDPGNGSILAGIEELVITAEDPEADPVQIRMEIDGDPVSTTGTYAWTTTLDPDGWYVIDINVTDGYLWTAGAIQVQVDNTPVEIIEITKSRTFLKIGDELRITANMTDFTGVRRAIVELDGHNYTLKDDGQSGDADQGDGLYGAIFQIPSATEGNKTLVVTATDLANNSVAVDGPLCVDETDPTILSVTTSRDYTSRFDPTFNVTVEAVDNYAIGNLSFDGVQLNRTRADIWSGTVGSSEDEGTYTLTVRAYDLAGREAVTDYGPMIVDNTLPSISEFEADPSIAEANDSIQVVVYCDDGLSGVSRVVFRLVSNMSDEVVHLEMDLLDDGQSGDSRPGDGIFGGQFTLNSTLADGNYTSEIETVDRSQNVATHRSTFIVDNTDPTIDLLFPDGSFLIQAEAGDANGIDRVEIYVNESIAKTCDGGTCSWEPDLNSTTGHANVTFLCYDVLNHSATASVPVWIIDDQRVLIGSQESGGMNLHIQSQDSTVPVEFVQAEFVENMTKEANFTATLRLQRTTGWGYSEVVVETNKTILFIARPDGEVLPEDQWWEEERDGKRILCIGDSSPSNEPYTVQFEPPPSKIPWSLILKVVLAGALIGMAYAVVSGRIPAIPGVELPSREEREKPLVPRPLEIPPPGAAEERRTPRPERSRKPPKRAPPARKGPPKPSKRPAKPERRPPQRPPKKPPEKPPEKAKPLVPRPSTREMPRRPKVPEKPRSGVEEGPSVFGRIADGFRKLFKRRRGGL